MSEKEDPKTMWDRLISRYTHSLREQELDPLRAQAAQFAAEAIWEETVDAQLHGGRGISSGPAGSLRSRYDVYLLTGHYPLDPQVERDCWALTSSIRLQR